MIFIRVEVENKRQFLKIENLENITIESFVKNVVKSFNLKDVKGVSFTICDPLETSIDSDEVLKHVLESRNFGDFYLKFDFKKQTTRQNELVLSTDIEAYVDANGGKPVLNAFKSEKRLSESMRRKLVNIIMEFMEEHYGLHPGQAEKIAIAKATVNYFTCFKTSGEHYYQMFYDPNGGKGWLTTALKSRRAAVAAVRANTQGTVEVTNSIDLNGNNQNVEFDAKSKVDLLRTLVVNKDTVPIIEQTLKQTLAYRREMFNDMNLNLLEVFPYFFHHPQLILFDFENIFHGSDIGDFRSFWLEHKMNMKDILELHGAYKDFASVYPSDIEEILMLLKLLKLRQTGKSTASARLNFPLAIERLIVFAKSGSAPMNAVKKDQSQPYIIAFGPSPKEIQLYFIVVDGNLINVPAEFTFIDAFDLFFKLHHVFNLGFDYALKPMMSFIQHYLYKIVQPDFKPTTHMVRVFTDISS